MYFLQTLAQASFAAYERCEAPPLPQPLLQHLFVERDQLTFPGAAVLKIHSLSPYLRHVIADTNEVVNEDDMALLEGTVERARLASQSLISLRKFSLFARYACGKLHRQMPDVILVPGNVIGMNCDPLLALRVLFMLSHSFFFSVCV